MTVCTRVVNRCEMKIGTDTMHEQFFFCSHFFTVDPEISQPMPNRLLSILKIKNDILLVYSIFVAL